MEKKVKVLVVDDSLMMREMLVKHLSQDPMIEVVGTANDAYMARDRIISLRPDVMTLDVEMPRLNGIEFLKMLMPQYPMPVIVVSGVSGTVFDAMNAGAVDFVEKKGSIDGDWVKELIFKIKIASVSKIRQKSMRTTMAAAVCNRIPSATIAKGPFPTNRLIAMGASTGGTEALHEVLKNLPANSPPIVIVQHMPPVFTRLYAERINSTCELEVKEAQNGDVLKPGHAFIAPGDAHLRVMRSGSQYILDVAKGEKVSGHCPSVDVLFHSVAENFKGQSFGLIMTGMGSDGAKGLLSMRQRGAVTLGQDEESCIVYGMPKVAYEIGAVQLQLPLKDMAFKLMDAVVNS